jgi:hypothetical protein
MLKWIALSLALALPVAGWAGTKALSSHCPLPCGDHCPFPCKSCPLKR